MIDLPMDAAPRDVRIAKAMLEYLAQPANYRNDPMRIAFTMYEDDCDVMIELCKYAGWESRKKWEYMRSTMSAVACRLARWGYLRKIDCRHNQEALENGEPARWYAYELHYKYRAKFNPTSWPHYRPDRAPADEMAYLLERVFEYEGKPAAATA